MENADFTLNNWNATEWFGTCLGTEVDLNKLVELQRRRGATHETPWRQICVNATRLDELHGTGKPASHFHSRIHRKIQQWCGTSPHHQPMSLTVLGMNTKEIFTPKIRTSSRQIKWSFIEPEHIVWKSQKKSHLTLRAKQATFTNLCGQEFIKNARNGLFVEFLKTWSLRLNSVTIIHFLNRTKIGGKRQWMRHFGWF